jgi:DNA replication protein DnaC
MRSGSRGRFFITVDLVNRLEAEGRAGRQGRLADFLTRLDFVILDELGYSESQRIRAHRVASTHSPTGLLIPPSLFADLSGTPP